MVIAPVRHVEGLEALTPEEQVALMPLATEVAAALRKETPCEKTYLAVFSEVLPHLHVHVIARPPHLPEADRGPGVFAAPPVGAPEAEEVSRRVLGRLASVSTPSAAQGGDPALRAALLSALVCPGAGQIRNRQYAKGLAIIGAVLVAAGGLFVRMLTEVFRAMPTDGTIVDPLSAWDLAREIQERNRGEFLTFSLALLALWVYATCDAWLVARRSARQGFRSDRSRRG
jgi:hypothetical protein